MKRNARQEKRRPQRTNPMTRHVENAVNGKRTTANHRGDAHQAKSSRRDWPALPDPPDKQNQQQQWREPSQFQRNPKPVALRMDDIVVSDRVVSVYGKDRRKIRKANAEQWHAPDQVDCV